MSLDVYLKRKKLVSYDEGKTHSEEYDELYWANITHNLATMADRAKIYEALWHPVMLNPKYREPDDQKEAYEYRDKFEEEHTVYARDIIKTIKKGLKRLKAKPEYYKQFDSPNGWGLYIHFVPFVEKYLEALEDYPDAIVQTST